MKRAVIILFTLIILSISLASYATEVVSANLDNAIAEAVLDGCGDLSFIISYNEPMFEVLIESHEVLGMESQGNEVTIWLIASAAVFKQNDSDGIRGNPSRVNFPIMLKFAKQNEEYNLLGYHEPNVDAWAESIRTMFPENLWEKAFSGNPQLFESLSESAEVYFESSAEEALENSCWREPISTDIKDPATLAIDKLFKHYPKWEGRVIRSAANGEQYWYYCTVEGNDGYYSPCRFDEYDIEGNLVSSATVQYSNGKLQLIEGDFPNE